MTTFDKVFYITSITLLAVSIWYMVLPHIRQGRRHKKACDGDDDIAFFAASYATIEILDPGFLVRHDKSTSNYKKVAELADQAEKLLETGEDPIWGLEFINGLLLTYIEDDSYDPITVPSRAADSDAPEYLSEIAVAYTKSLREIADDMAERRKHWKKVKKVILENRAKDNDRRFWVL